MSRPRLDVQLCVLCHTARQYGPHPTSDLLGVDYFYTVPPDTEFPRIVSRMDLFVRFLVAGLRATVIRVRIVRLDESGDDQERVNEYRFPVPFDTADRVRELSFRLPQVRLTGEGTYAVRVGRVVRRGWKGTEWRTLGADYFCVVR